ncbi:hypothetical protein chiPu_0028068, partial [Chiloscyllium punctatum]|nr:hypothetical protein [Chiloscyllium punctatum]
PVGTGLDPLEGRPKLMEWGERVKREVGKELFDEAHEKLMKEKELLKRIDPKSPLTQQLAKKLQKVYK